MDVNEELKFLRKFKKKIEGVGLGAVRVGEVRLDVKEKLKFL